MSATRTGSLKIGFRRGWSDWQKDLSSLITWSTESGFAHIDVGASVDDVEAVVASGIGLGSVDLPDWQGLMSADAGKRRESAAANIEFIKATAALGAKAFFVVMLPEDPALPRNKNFEYMVDGYGELMPVLESVGGCIVIEGYPGPGALCCTPESYRAFQKELPSVANQINYDPSHLVRMGIDPIRFLEEFADRVAHVHAKDTELLADRLYDLGTEQPATAAERIPFGGSHWRYTLPGHGCVRWTKSFELLAAAGYQGLVSVELEDANFNGTTDGEKAGLVHSLNYLLGC